MSLFDFPRIHFKGTIQLNPGTANNDDFAPTVVMPPEWGPFAGEPFGLVDSKLVRARTFGMSDDAFIAWVQKNQTLQGTNGKPTRVMPSEWNYYGDMSSNASAKVIGVQTAPGRTYTSVDAKVAQTSLIGQAVTWSGGITDVNSEGSPPATQFFIDALKVGSVISGQPSKGACQWINFFRNVNLVADGGAGGYIYHVLRKGEGTTIDLPGFDGPNVRGIILRYYLYRTIQGSGSLEEIYKQKKTNPATLEVAGTIAPLLDSDLITTGPVGRLLIQNEQNIPTPEGTKNNGGGKVALAPAVLQQNGTMLSADFIGTFPDYYSKKTNANPKFNFGPVNLVVKGGGSSVTIDAIDYADTAAGDARGWIFDFNIAKNTDAQKALKDPNATFSLFATQVNATVLAETEYYFPSNQQGIYTEQHGSGDRFLNQGSEAPATVSVYRYGKLLAREECPPITVWQYRSIPLESPGNAIALNTNFLPGDPIRVDTSQPGNFLFTFTISGAPPSGYPPKSYLDFQNPPWITNAPSISLRILPNDEDFSRYYEDPAMPEPAGNALLTFDVVYTKVLRTYYLLYPAMNKIFPLNDEQSVTKAAKAILARTEMALWMTTSFMPRTRDMSESRRRLLRAWCRRVTA